MILIIIGLILLIAGVVLTLGLIHPNPCCGFSSRWALCDPVVWKQTNTLCGEAILVWSGLLLYSHWQDPVFSLKLVLIPALGITIFSVLFSAVMFKARWKTFQTPNISFVRTLHKAPVWAELLLLVVAFIPAVVVIGGFVEIPRFVPVTFSVYGEPAVWGQGVTLVRVFFVPAVIGIVLSVWSSTIPYPDMRSVWSIVAVRAGIIISLASYGFSLLWYSEGNPLNPWKYLAFGLLVLLGGGGSLAGCCMTASLSRVMITGGNVLEQSFPGDDSLSGELVDDSSDTIAVGSPSADSEDMCETVHQACDHELPDIDTPICDESEQEKEKSVGGNQ